MISLLSYFGLSGKGIQECRGLILVAKGSLFVGILVLVYKFSAHVCAYYIGVVKPNKHRVSFIALGKDDVGACYDGNGKRCMWTPGTHEHVRISHERGG